ncbi:MAG: apolipoprotein N-acyltransferase [SAR324 cluster bacterium]|nr:apolipoprotein N-acyltransferase [SAR324 cluster bacterium]
MMVSSVFCLLLSSLFLCLPFQISSVSLLGWIAWTPVLTLFGCSSQSLLFKNTFCWFLRGWTIGCLWYGSLFYWLPETLYIKAGLSVFRTALFSLGTVGLLACFPALVLLLCSLLQHVKFSPYLSFPILFTVQEGLLEYVPFGGVPWATMAASQSLGKWGLWVVSHFGGLGLTFLMTAVAASLASLLVNFRIIFFVSLRTKGETSFLILVLVTSILGAFILSYPTQLFTENQNTGHNNRSSKNVPVLLVPNDVSIGNLNNPGMLRNILQNYLRNSVNQALVDKVSLVIWPENAYPGIIERGKNLVTLFHAFSKAKADLILGSNGQKSTVSGQQSQAKVTPQYFNSAYLVYHQYFEFERYDKRQLVPFAEYVPAGWKRLIPHSILPQVPDYARGSKTGIFHWKETPFGIFICFETIFSRMIRASVQEGSQFLVGISNGQWLNRWAAQHQLRLATLRAVEAGRDIILVGNGGKTAHIQVDSTEIRVQQIDKPTTVLVKPKSCQNWYVLYGIWPCFGLMGGYFSIFLLFQFCTRRNHTIQ